MEQIDINGPWRPGWFVAQWQAFEMTGANIRLHYPVEAVVTQYADDAIYKAAPWLKRHTC